MNDDELMPGWAETPIAFPSRCLILLAGLPGAGKTSFCRRHFAASEIVSPDTCRWLLGDDEDAQDASWQADALAIHLIETRLSLGRRVVADGGTLCPHRRGRLRQLAAHYRVPAYLLILTTPVERAAERAARRKRIVSRPVIDRCLPEYESLRRDAASEGYAGTWLVTA